MVVSMTIALGLSACGGSGTSDDGDNGGDSSVKTGIFIDAPVKGLQYKTSTQEGVTTVTGEFNYKAGEQITYSIDGVDIGSATAAPQVLVTDLPNALQIAQLLQSLDITIPDDNFIDITGVKFPAGLKSALMSLIDSGVGSFEDILTTEHLELINTESGGVLDNTNPVTEDEALVHLDDVFDVDFTPEDINRQTFVGMDDGLFVLSFKDNDKGNEFLSEGENGQPEKDSFDWSVAADTGQLSLAYVGETSPTLVDLLNTSGNTYGLKVQDGDGTFVATLNKALPLSVAALDGKILAFDTSNDPECSARTAKIETTAAGTKAFVKELCSGVFNEDTLELSDASLLDNTIYLEKKDQNGNTLASTKVHLFKGDVTDGTYVFIDEPQNDAPSAVFTQKIAVTNAEVTDASAATRALLAGKTFYAYFLDDGTPALAKLVINSNVDSWDFTILAGLDSATGTEALQVAGDQLTITHSDGNETVQVSANDPKFLSLGVNNSFGRFYYNQADAQAHYDSQTSSTDTAFKFTTDFLNGNTFYDIFLGFNSAVWEKETFSFTGTTFNLSEIVNGQSVSGENISYTITNEGYITFFDTEDDETTYIKPIEKTADFIKIYWSSQTGELNTNDSIEYLFFDEATGDAFLADKNASTTSTSKTSISYMKTHATERLASTDCSDRSWSSWRDAKNTLIGDLAPADNMMKSIEACISVQNLIENGNQTFSNAVRSVVLGRSASGSPFSDVFDPNGTL